VLHWPASSSDSDYTVIIVIYPTTNARTTSHLAALFSVAEQRGSPAQSRARLRFERAGGAGSRSGSIRVCRTGSPTPRHRHWWADVMVGERRISDIIKRHILKYKLEFGSELPIQWLRWGSGPERVFSVGVPMASLIGKIGRHLCANLGSADRRPTDGRCTGGSSTRSVGRRPLETEITTQFGFYRRFRPMAKISPKAARGTSNSSGLDSRSTPVPEGLSTILLPYYRKICLLLSNTGQSRPRIDPSGPSRHVREQSRRVGRAAVVGGAVRTAEPVRQRARRGRGRRRG